MKQIKNLFVENSKPEFNNESTVDVNYLYSQLYIGKITLQEYLAVIKNN